MELALRYCHTVIDELDFCAHLLRITNGRRSTVVEPLIQTIGTTCCLQSITLLLIIASWASLADDVSLAANEPSAKPMRFSVDAFWQSTFDQSTVLDFFHLFHGLLDYGSLLVNHNRESHVRHAGIDVRDRF